MCFGINKLLLGYSTTATAVFGAYFKLQTFVYMAVFGLNNALIPIVAYNYGAKKGDRIRSAIVLCGIFSTVIGLVGTLIMELFPSQLIDAFSPSEEMYCLGVTALRILGLTFTFGSVSVMVSYALQGFSRGVSSLIVSAGRQVILLLPLAVLLGSIMGITGIWWSFFVAEVIVMILAVIFLGIIEKKEIAALEG
jgi:Na+-driven multidrug efflux pump